MVYQGSLDGDGLHLIHLLLSWMHQYSSSPLPHSVFVQTRLSSFGLYNYCVLVSSHFMDCSPCDEWRWVDGCSDEWIRERVIDRNLLRLDATNYVGKRNIQIIQQSLFLSLSIAYQWIHSIARGQCVKHYSSQRIVASSDITVEDMVYL